MRYKGLDILRGFALVNMIIYHALWDMVDVFGIRLRWFESPGAAIWQQFGCSIFILLSGFCFNLGRHRVKRGITVLACSAVISGVTAVVIPQNLILFGVLTFLGSAMLIMIPLDKAFSKVNPFVGAVASFLLFISTKNIPLGGAPDGWYANLFTAYLGFPPSEFVSQDYFPIIPWLFLFVAGYFLHNIFKKHNLMYVLSRVQCEPLEWMGRHSLIIYMLHQPLLYGILVMVNKLV